MGNDSREGIVVSVRQRLLNLSKARSEDYNLILTRYALERFLFRLSQSQYRQDFILKGAMLFQIWSQTPHRATKDLDLLASGEVSLDKIKAKVHEICTIDVETDGLSFDVTKLSVVDIREDDRYGGVRAKFLAMLGSAKITIQIDFGVGDAVTPSPTEIRYPTLLGMSPPHILAYPRETVVAEKLEAMVDLGMDNSRMKDYFDLWFIATVYRDNPELLMLAVQRTFARRRQPLPCSVPIGLSDEFAKSEGKQKQWLAFTSRTLSVSVSLEEVVREIRAFAMPLFAQEDMS